MLFWGDKSPVIATDAIIPRRPPTLGGEFKVWTTAILSPYNILTYSNSALRKRAV